MLKSELLLRVLLSQEGVVEEGGNNRGAKVEEYQRADDLPGEGYAWCVSVLQWAAKLAGISLPSGTASVGLLEQAYRKAGWIEQTPSRGCQGFWRLDGDGWPDHLFTVTAVKQLGPVLILRTIEGNTSSGEVGSQDDGGGVHQRLRFIRASRVTFGKVPGSTPNLTADAVLAAVAPRLPVGKPLLPARKPMSARYWKWLRWTLGEGEYQFLGPFNMRFRPTSAPRTIPDSWWEQREEFIARRLKAA